MSKPLEKALLFLSDGLATHLAFGAWAALRQRHGFYAEPELQQFLLNATVIFLFWLALFVFFGLYRSWYAQSRVDEFLGVAKVVSLGVLLIFLATFEPQQDFSNPLSSSRAMILSYWLLMIVAVSGGRLLLRTFQRTLLEAGIGVRRTVIAGWGRRARELFDHLRKSPALGYEVLGFIDLQPPQAPEVYRACPVLGSLPDLPALLQQNNITEVLIAFDGDSREHVAAVLRVCEAVPVRCKIVPALVDVIIGQARTNQIYGFPLIDVMPEPMAAWERHVKRLADVVIAAAGLVLLLPFWLPALLAIWAETRQPVFCEQWRVGLRGRRFKRYLLRTAKNGSRENVGTPQEGKVGRAIRRLHLEGVPQLWNVLKGEMSLVGPRAERPELVGGLQRDIPFYFRRLHVKPGIIGWAQLKGDCDAALETVKAMLPYDFFYIENMSLRMDLKISLNAIYAGLLRRKS